MEILITIGYIAICVLFFSLAIAIHEFGHFIVALKLGLKVDRFSIGFGPAIWKKTWRGVEYRISWIPLGGYVMIPDVDPEGTKKLEGEAKNGETETGKREISPWKEIAVAVAGPGMNIFLAVVLAFILSALSADKFGELTCEVTDTLKGMPAENAGVKKQLRYPGGNPDTGVRHPRQERRGAHSCDDARPGQGHRRVCDWRPQPSDGERPEALAPGEEPAEAASLGRRVDIPSAEGACDSEGDEEHRKGPGRSADDR